MKAIKKTHTYKPKPHGVRYPWHEWFALDRFRLVQGQHYEGRTYAMANQVRNVAPLHGVRVSISVAADEGSLTVTVKR